MTYPYFARLGVGTIPRPPWRDYDPGAALAQALLRRGPGCYGAHPTAPCGRDTEGRVTVRFGKGPEAAAMSAECCEPCGRRLQRAVAEIAGDRDDLRASWTPARGRA